MDRGFREGVSGTGDAGIYRGVRHRGSRQAEPGSGAKTVDCQVRDSVSGPGGTFQQAHRHRHVPERATNVLGRVGCWRRERRPRVSFGFRRRGESAASSSSPGFLSRFARATAAIALTVLVMSGATLGLVTPVHAASDGDLRIEDGPSDDAVSADTLPAANPATGVAASNPTQTTVDLSWTLPTQPEGVNVTGVEVQQQAVDQSWVTVATLAADATSYTVTGLTTGASYSFRIRLVTSRGDADSDAVSASTLAAVNPATGVTASNATPTSVDLAWALPAQPVGVTVTRVLLLQQVVGDSRTKIVPLAADATSHTVTGLSANTSYSFRIEIVTSSGSAESDAVLADTLVAPNAATGLTASNVTYTTVDLSWTLPEQPEGVTVSAVEVVQLLDYGEEATVATLAADVMSYKVTELAAGTDHFFRIRLVTNRGTALTLAVSASTLAGPNPPTNFTASNETETTVDLAWTFPAQPDGVTVTGVEVRQEKANPYVVDEHLTRPTTTVATLAADATSYTVTALTEVRRYTYRIRLITNGQGHADSQPVTISKIPNPRPPTGLAASNATSSTVDLSWTLPEQPEGVSVRGIRVWQEVDQEPEPRPSSSHSPTAFDFPHTAWLSSTMLGADTTSHTVTGLTPETEYRFKISLDLDIDGATNVDGGGPANRWSKPVGVTTLAAADPATGLTASNPTQTTVDLAWTLPTQATGVTVTSVEVQQQAADQSWTTAATLASDATSHTVTGLTAGTSYTFRIRLVTSSGNADSEPVETQTLQTLLEAKMAGSVPPAQGRDGLEFSLSRSTGGRPGACAVEVSVAFLDGDGEAVAVNGLAASDFTAENGRVGTPVAAADGLSWTVPVRATTDRRGFLRVRLPATERWRADEQVFHNRGAGVCAPAARWELADLRLYDLRISPSFRSTTTEYTDETMDADAEVVAEAVYADATVTIAPADADEDTDGHQVALPVGETEVTVTVTPGDGSAAQTYTVAVTREAAVRALTGFVLVDASTDTDLGAVESGATVTVAPGGSYGIRAEVDEDAEVGSVTLMLRGPGADGAEHKQTENAAPYSLYGDAGGAEHGRALAAGSYMLTATAYSDRYGAGRLLNTLVRRFKVAEDAAAPPSAGVLTGFTLVDVSDQSTVAALVDGAEVDLGARFAGSFGIRAEVAPNAAVGSVVLSLSGAKTVSRRENIAPWSLWGDVNRGADSALHGEALPAGSYTLTATAYAKRRAEGAVRGTLSVWFDILAPAALSVADASAEEGTDATLDFAVTLDREAAHTVTVAYATSDVTATAGSDYTATSGTLSFAPGETEKTVSVPVLVDDVDEGSETLTLTLSSPSGAVIADGEATGTITNEGPIPKAWLARFGRTVTGQVLEAVEARLTTPRAAGAKASLAGQALPSWRADGPAGSDTKAAAKAEQAEAEDRAALASMTAWLTQAGRDPGRVSGAGGQGTAWFGATSDGMGRGHESRALTQRDLMVGTSFALTGGSAERGGFAALWGRASIAGFDGREGSLTVDGEVTTGLIGADWASGSGAGRWTAGLALGHSTGTGGWRGANGSGSIDAVLTGLYPYAGVDLTERLSLWAAVGWGSGEVTVTRDGGAGLTADLSMSMGAAGLRGEVLKPEGEHGLTLAVKSDARFTRTSSDAARSADGNLEAAEADVWMMRTGVEGSRRFALGRADEGASVTPSFELGLRLDGGDAETGMGADLGGGVAFADPKNGVALDMQARGLVAHEAPGFREWGASLAASWDPRPTTDRGLSLTLRQSWGASPSGGMDALLSRETLAGLAANDPGSGSGAGGKFEASSRLEGEVGYGLPAFGGAFTSTPNVGFALSDDGAREWRLGWRLTSAISGDPGFQVSLDATRSEPANDEEPEHGVTLKAAIRW